MLCALLCVVSVHFFACPKKRTKKRAPPNKDALLSLHAHAILHFVQENASIKSSSAHRRTFGGRPALGLFCQALFDYSRVLLPYAIRSAGRRSSPLQVASALIQKGSGSTAHIFISCGTRGSYVGYVLIPSMYIGGRLSKFQEIHTRILWRDRLKK